MKGTKEEKTIEYRRYAEFKEMNPFLYINRDIEKKFGYAARINKFLPLMDDMAEILITRANA